MCTLDHPSLIPPFVGIQLLSHISVSGERSLRSGGRRSQAVAGGQTQAGSVTAQAQDGTSATMQIMPGDDSVSSVYRYWKRTNSLVGKGIFRSHYDSKNSH